MTLNPIHRKPRGAAPDPFVSKCFAQLNVTPNQLVLDLACGYGRHSILFASQGCTVVAADLNLASLLDLSGNGHSSILPVAVNADRELPFLDSTFHVVVACEYVARGLLRRSCDALCQGGHLIYKTFAGRGQNWRSLPDLGVTVAELHRSVTLLEYEERPVSRSGNSTATVKLFARKN